MKRVFLFVLPIMVIAGFLLARTLGQEAPIGQERMEQNGIVMLPSTIPVDLELQRHVLEVITQKAPALGIDTYAITNVDQRDGYYYVSVAGLPIGSTEMRLEDAIWLGVVTLADLPGMPGEVVDAMPSFSAEGDQSAGPGIGGAQNILPFRSGTTAIYGQLGVHNCGFSLNGWKAVDLFPTENMVYASASGDVSYVCRDENQVALRVGQNLYTHLVDSGQAIGDHYDQGQAMGGMVPGTYNSTCGYADQQPNNYHVHFCFVPHSGVSWSADGYALSVINGNWVKGSDTVAPLGTLTADWQSANVGQPGPAAGANFWDSLAGGFTQLISKIVPALPEHQPMGLAQTVMSTAWPVIRLLYVLVFSVFDMTIPMWVLGIWFILESVRLVYAAWMWIKRAIPVIG